MLTRSANGERALVLDSYLESDILGLSSESSSPTADDDPDLVPKAGDSVLEALLPDQTMNHFQGDSDDVYLGERERHHPARLQQSSIARLVNAMASIKRGRDYLGGHDPLVDKLIDCLLSLGSRRALDTVEMVLATLQKLSLK